MAQRSIVARTGQAWKYYVGLFGALLGVMASILVVLTQRPTAERTVGSFLKLQIGAVVTVASVLYLCLADRCPRCGARWFWKALRRWRGSRWLRSLSNCPTCHYSGQGGPRRKG